jgi:hypothetical protein
MAGTLLASDNDTILKWVVYYFYVEIVQYLLDRGGNVDVETRIDALH